MGGGVDASEFTLDGYFKTASSEIKGGAMLCQSGDMPGFVRIGEKDRFFAEVKYSF